MQLHQILFKIPRKGEPVLGLTPRESNYLVKLLKSFPFRTHPASPQVSAAFTRLYFICHKESKTSPLRSLKMKSAAIDLFVSLAEMSENPSKTKVEVNPKLKVVIERMTKHPEDSFPLSAMARESALSEVMFTSAFKRATGLTPHAYLLDIRIKHARAKIIAGEKSITQIALRYGFKTARHFSAVFKRITGQTPSQCRDSAKRHNMHNKQLKSRQQLKSPLTLP
jgi:AraC-like DNA-binding protein